LEDLRKRLEDAEQIVSGKACVYVTGSFARGEASSHSDLDLFIVGKGEGEGRDLSRLDEIVVMAELIGAMRDMGLPEFSGDGDCRSWSAT
jgi:predicted nucleotidyltransferase